MDRARPKALFLFSITLCACYPDFQFKDPGSTSSSSGSSSTSTSSGGGESCEIIHPGGGTCEYLPGSACGCTGEDKCSVVNEATGRAGCTLAGSKLRYERCLSDNDCDQGTWCDHSAGACAKICRNFEDCGKGAHCIPALTQEGATIPGLKVCTAHCEPITGAPCGENLNCIYKAEITEFDCARSLLFKQDVPCQDSSNCDKGLACAVIGGQTEGTCDRWCTPPDPTVKNPACPTAKPFCDPLKILAKHDNVEYGTCSAP